MKTFAFGSLRFQRESIPVELRDWSVWPIVDDLSLDDEQRKAYQCREKAIRYFVGNPEMRIADICRATGVSTSTLYRLFERCCEKHPDGRIYGFRGLIRYQRVARYSRTKPIARSGVKEKGGAAGAFSMLLDRYPSLEVFLVKELKRRIRRIDAAEEVRKSVKKIP
jgi:AraC-like DNA-binding protein